VTGLPPTNLQKGSPPIVNQEALREYLLTIARDGYADTEKQREWKKLPDRSTTIAHQSGQWRMDDNFFGGEPYGGREVVFFEDRPVWMMVYFGEVATSESNVGAVYACLQKALSEPDEVTPVRGPREIQLDSMKYETTWEGDILRFKGVERISRDGEEIYTASYAGGLVDRRGE
jgi:hypothetical protein